MRIDNQGTVKGYDSVKVEPVRSSSSPDTQTAFNSSLNTAEESSYTANAQYNEKDIASAADFINKALQVANSHLEFKFHEDSGRYQIKIVDDISSEVIKEIPPENILEISAMIKKKLDEMLGVLVDKLA